MACRPGKVKYDGRRLDTMRDPDKLSLLPRAFAPWDRRAGRRGGGRRRQAGGSARGVASVWAKRM